MNSLITCDACNGFIPHAQACCPHCDADTPSLAKKVFSLAAGGAMAMTLMACYGAMPREYKEPPQNMHCTDPGSDTDKDGYCHPHDCDEVNAAIHPGAEDPPQDGIDQNCDGHDG